MINAVRQRTRRLLERRGFGFQQLAGTLALATGAVFASSCAVSHEPAAGLSPDERRAAREVPGSGSATVEFRGVEYVATFALGVIGDRVEFQLSARDPRTGATIYAQLPVNDPASLRRPEGVSYDASATAPDYVASLGYTNLARGEDQMLLAQAIRVRSDADAMLAADLDVRVGLVRAPDTTWLDVNDADIERLTIRGHLTSTCSVVVHGSTVLLDPERTANPLCRELLEGL